MANDPSIWVEIGMRKADLVAGLSGGIVNAFVFKRSDPWSIIGSVIVGAFSANYLAEPVGHITGTTGGTTAFIVGLAGMAICQGIVEAAKAWRPFNSNRTTPDANPPAP